MGAACAVVLCVIAILLVATLSDAVPSLGKGQPSLGIASEKYGYGMGQSRVGLPLLISYMYLNTDHFPQNLTVIFEVRNENVTIQLDWKDHVAYPSETSFVSTSWVPASAGEYQVQAFVISNFTNPEVLRGVDMFSFKVISDEDFERMYSDRPTGFDLKPVDAARPSENTSAIKFGKPLQFANDIKSPNTYIGDIATTNDSIFLIGTTEVPPLRENPPQSGGNVLTFFAASSNNGATFTPAKYLVNNTRGLVFSSQPHIHAVNETFVYASWLQEEPWMSVWNIIFSRSLNGGMTFDKSVRIDAAGYGSLDMASSDDGKSIYLAWGESNYKGEQKQHALLLSQSEDYGASFTPARAILNYTGSEGIDCAQVAIQRTDVANATSVYVTWRQASEDKEVKVLIAASHDAGITFSDPTVISSAYNEDWDCPKFGVYGNEVYLAWMETKLLYKPEDPSELLVGDTDIFFVASHDNGRTFQSPINISEGIGAFNSEPEILFSHGQIYAVWRDTIPEVKGGFLTYYGNAEIVMTRSLDGGRTFEKPVNLSNNPSGSYQPSIAVHDNDIFVAWLESDFPSDNATVSLRISRDGGKTFTDVSKDLVGIMPETLGPPQVIASGDGQILYIFWSQSQEPSYLAENYILVGRVSERLD